MTSSLPPSLPVLRQLLAEAQDEVVRLCAGSRWRMSVPVDEARDSDVVLMNVLTAASDLVERQAAAIEAVQAEMRDWAKRCPEDDWGSGDIADMVLADAGRHVLTKIKNHLSSVITPTTEENTDER